MLKKHLLEAPNNATYLSGKMQNEIISVCGLTIQKQIASKINRAKFFSVLADETADVSGVEQFSICTCYRCYWQRVSYKNIRNSKLFKYRNKIFKGSRI